MEPATAILLASAASSAASLYNNSQNIKYASEANDTSVSLANTAHQREVRDLEAAGLNPVLSASSNGAAVPQLNIPNLEGIDGSIGNNATSLARALSGTMDAEKKLKESQTDVNTAQSFNLKQDGVLKKVQADVLRSSANTSRSFLDKVRSVMKVIGEGIGNDLGTYVGRREGRVHHPTRYTRDTKYILDYFKDDKPKFNGDNMRLYDPPVYWRDPILSF